MAYTHLYVYEKFLRGLMDDGRPIKQAEYEPLRKQIMEALERIPSLLVQKTHRTQRKEGLLEFSCLWVGADPSHDAVREALREVWPGSNLDKSEELHIIESEDETVVLRSASKAVEGRYATVKVLVIVA